MRIDAPIITGSFSLNGDALIDLNVLTTTGSNTFIGNQSIIGAISASALTGSIDFTNLTNSPTLVSGSSQIVNILSSLNTFSASNGNESLNSYTSSQDTKNTTLGSYTGSNDTKWTSIGNLTGSYATTGSNTFYGTQVFSGSVFIATDLIVQGSSSIQYISASSVSIGTNIVQLNTANPSVRFAGLTIIDSGSIGGSGSFLYDSVHDEFVFVHRGNGTNVTSSHFVLGPETYDSLGNETYLTTNILTKGTGKEHLVDSCIFDNGTTTCIKNNLVGTGTATIGSDIVLSAANPVIYGGTTVGGVSISNNTGGSYIKIFGACHATTPNTTAFVNANSTVLTISSTGATCFANTVTASNYNACGNYYARYGAGDRMAFIYSEDYYFGMTNPSSDVRALKITAQAIDGVSTIQFYTGNNAERMRISNTGKVYIGTLVNCWTDTAFKTLQIGNGSINNVGTQTQIVNNIYYDDVSYKYLTAGTANRLIFTTDGNFQIETAPSGNTGCAVTLSTRMFICGNNGNVGIGVSPGYRLDVSSGASGIVLNLDGTNAYNAETGIQMATNRAKISAFLNGSGGTPGSSLRLYTMPDGGSVTERMRIDSNGVTCFYNSVGMGSNLVVGSTISAGGSISGTLLTTQTQRLVNSTGGFANMVQKIHGAAGAFSQLVICVNLVGAGGWGYIINAGGTSGGIFQSGGGYINSPGNFSHNVAVGCGFTVSCHTCAGTNDMVRFVGVGGVHPFVSIQMFGSLNQFINDDSIYIAYS